MHAPLTLGLVLLSAVAAGAAEPAKPDAPGAGPIRVVIAATKVKELVDFGAHLEKDHGCKVAWIEAKKGGDVTGIENLDACDVMLLNLYRTEPNADALAKFQAYFKSNKGTVGLRKASHAFQNWLAVDKEVFGFKYGGHFLLNKKDLTMEIVEKAPNRALVGSLKPFLPGGGLYKYTEPAEDVQVLVTGGEPGNMMPQVWTRVTGGRRVFYSRYDPKDLSDPGCRAMTVNALLWAAGRAAPK
jgi:type 1 glutamine amidotransferase